MNGTEVTVAEVPISLCIFRVLCCSVEVASFKVILWLGYNSGCFESCVVIHKFLFDTHLVYLLLKGVPASGRDGRFNGVQESPFRWRCYLLTATVCWAVGGCLGLREIFFGINRRR